MKALIPALLMLLAPGAAATQTAQTASAPAAAPGVAVVEKSWRRDVVRTPGYDDPLGTLEAQDRAQRRRDEVIAANVQRAAIGQPPLTVPSRTVNHKTPVSRISRPSAPQYVYEVKLSNTGAKKIRQLEWGYVLLDPDTGREISNLRFTSKVGIDPGKTKKLVGRAAFAPATVSAAQGAKDLRDQYSERVEIHRIEYDDGSFWERPSN